MCTWLGGVCFVPSTLICLYILRAHHSSPTLPPFFLGDLKYKGNTDLPPAEQIITAEPDLRHVNLTNEDEFIVLACDGVWDCRTNQVR